MSLTILTVTFNTCSFQFFSDWLRFVKYTVSTNTSDSTEEGIHYSQLL